MDFELFRVELEQVVLVALNDERTALVISSWRPGKGLAEDRSAEPAWRSTWNPRAARRWTERAPRHDTGTP